MAVNFIYSTVNTLRDRYAPVTTTSTFRRTGEITPQEFLEAGDYLVDKFRTWSWADADDPSRRVDHLPPGKQYLVTRNVPCFRRLDDDFAGDAGREQSVVGDGEGFAGRGAGDDDGWLRTGGLASSQPLKAREIRTVDEAGNVGEGQVVDDDEIPDMEDEEDDDAIIKDTGAGSKTRSYNVYIMYSPYYRTPRLYLSGYLPTGQPLPPNLTMDDIVGDYKDKTVTLEDFPFFASTLKMASVHPCKHAPVMKTLLDRADAALRIKRERMKGEAAALGDVAAEMGKMDIRGAEAEAEAADKGDEWEEVQQNEIDDQEVAIRVDQYLVVFLKFMASVTPGIEIDSTMSV